MNLLGPDFFLIYEQKNLNMQTRKLGYSDLELTTIGLGTWAMGGGDWKFGWGPQDDQASIHAIHKALDLGINWIDTAPIYGHGHAEGVVGKAIAGRRDSIIIATKCGRIWEGNSREIGKSLRRDSIKREVENSLRRLNIDVIDLYQIHWPQPDEEIEEGWQAMADLVKEGKVRYIGVSNFNLEQLQRAQAIHPIVSLQPPYSMLNRGVEEELRGGFDGSRQPGRIGTSLSRAKPRRLDRFDRQPAIGFRRCRTLQEKPSELSCYSGVPFGKCPRSGADVD